MKNCKWISAGVVTLALCVAPGLASAATLIFAEQGDSVVVQRDPFFECGFSSSTSGENAHVDACWITNSPPGYSGAATAYMVEPAGRPNAGSISDQIRIEFTVDTSGLAHMVADFLSDPDGAPPQFPPPGVQPVV